MIKESIKKIILLTLLITMIFSINCNFIYATPTSQQQVTQPTEGGGDGGGTSGTTMKSLISDLDKGSENKNDNAVKKVNEVVAIVITVARVVGVAVAIVMLLAVAMKYMTAAPGEKADIKKSAVVYVVGAVVLFAVTGILGIINSFASNIKVS